jgi:hypothetical protein
MRKLYNSQRDAEENNARINDFTPIFVYRTVREILRERCEMPSTVPAF